MTTTSVGSMKLGRYLPFDSPVTVSFVGDRSAEITGTAVTYDEHGLVLFREDKLRYIPWTAVGMVTRESDAEDEESSDG